MAAPITGTNGTFTTTKTTGKSYNGEKLSDRITINYKPNAGACTDIRLVQTVSWASYDSSGNVIGKEPKDVYKPGKDVRYKHRRPDQITVNGMIYVIDYKPCEADPYYNGEDKQDKKSKGNATNGDETKMSDTPGANVWASSVYRGNFVKLVKTFEVCAICVSSGEVLDCISWTSTATKSPKDAGTITEPTGIGTQSEAHKKAIKQFVKTHSKTKGGKKYWYCPQTKTSKAEIPKGFQNVWATVADDENSYYHSSPDEEYVGTGQFEEVPDEVFASIFQSPDTSAIKLTWSGEQDKTTASVLFSPLREVLNQRLAAFIPKDDGRFENDFESIISVQVDNDFFLQFLASLSAHKAALIEPGGAVSITVIANIEGPSGVGFMGSISPHELQQVLNNFLPLSTLSQDIHDTVGYLALNMGESESVSDCPPYYKKHGIENEVGKEDFSEFSERIGVLKKLVLSILVINIVAFIIILMLD